MLYLVKKRPDDAIRSSEEALKVARELGHLRLEATVLCNLGLAKEECGLRQEALASFDEALNAARRLGDHRREGQFLGYIGRTRSRLREFDVARQCFAAGKAILEEVSDALSLGVLLCDYAECEWRAGNIETGRQVLEEARTMVDVARAGPQSEVGQALTRLEALLNFPRGEPDVTPH